MDERLRFVARLLEGGKMALSRLARLFVTIFEAKVTARERTAGAGLEVLLKLHGLGFGAKLHRYNDRPWPVCNGVAGRATVMPVWAGGQIVRDADVVTRRI